MTRTTTLLAAFALTSAIAGAGFAQTTGSDASVAAPAPASAPRAMPAAVPAYAGPRVLVIPFVTLNVPEGSEWIGRAIEENIVADFGRGRVFSPIAFKGQLVVEDNASAIALAHKANADYVVRGAVQLVEQNLRITAQFIDARNGDTISTASVTGSAKELLRLEDEIASALRMTATPVVTAEQQPPPYAPSNSYYPPTPTATDSGYTPGYSYTPTYYTPTYDYGYADNYPSYSYPYYGYGYTYPYYGGYDYYPYVYFGGGYYYYGYHNHGHDHDHDGDHHGNWNHGNWNHGGGNNGGNWNHGGNWNANGWTHGAGNGATHYTTGSVAARSSGGFSGGGLHGASTAGGFSHGPVMTGGGGRAGGIGGGFGGGGMGIGGGHGGFGGGGGHR